MKAPLRTVISKAGQPYVDEAVYVKPKPVAPIERAVASIFDRRLPGPIETGHTRVRLRWKKPDGRGGLIPR